MRNGTQTALLLERLKAKLPEATPTQAAAMRETLGRATTARCAGDLFFWLRFVQTRDEADPEQAVKPFPVHLDYIRTLMQLIATERILAVAKSRQMLVSWAVCAYMVWHARFRPHQAILYQTQNWPDAIKMVAMPGSASAGFMGRCQFIEAHLPVWMRQPINATEGRIQYPNGSLIEGLPGGADKVRGKTASLIVLDEMAFLEDAKGTYTAIAPLVQKGARLIMVSTPNGAEGNVFYHLWHGLPFSQSAAA